MVHWMVPMPNIKSRCGFCPKTMDTWSERTDHLAEHFKTGLTMGDWKGDWGFEDRVLKLVESAVPPCKPFSRRYENLNAYFALADFIEYERNSLIPMRASDPPWGSPPNGYELLKIEIEYYVQTCFDTTGRLPSNDCMQLEACRVIFAAEAIVDIEHVTATKHNVSWLRDLVMSSVKLTSRARFGPIRTSSESRYSAPRINGKLHLFEQCPLEQRLHAFVVEQRLSGAWPDDGQIQNAACEIVRQMEKASPMPSDLVANWIVKGIYSGAAWLTDFKQRAGISDILSTTLNTSLLDLETQGTDPSQEVPVTYPTWSMTDLSPISRTDLYDQVPSISTTEALPFLAPTTNFDMRGRPKAHLPDDTNFFRTFENDIKRWVAATMSPKNPNCHVPSDEEIQHQARWIMYDGDDPWNQTPADYAEFLWRFKRDVGITQQLDGEAVDTEKLLESGLNSQGR